jgi:hypothetical protein
VTIGSSPAPDSKGPADKGRHEPKFWDIASFLADQIYALARYFFQLSERRCDDTSYGLDTEASGISLTRFCQLKDTRTNLRAARFRSLIRSQGVPGFIKNGLYQGESFGA